MPLGSAKGVADASIRKCHAYFSAYAAKPGDLPYGLALTSNESSPPQIAAATRAFSRFGFALQADAKGVRARAGLEDERYAAMSGEERAIAFGAAKIKRGRSLLHSYLSRGGAKPKKANGPGVRRARSALCVNHLLFARLYHDRSNLAVNQQPRLADFRRELGAEEFLQRHQQSARDLNIIGARGLIFEEVALSEFSQPAGDLLQAGQALHDRTQHGDEHQGLGRQVALEVWPQFGICLEQHGVETLAKFHASG